MAIDNRQSILIVIKKLQKKSNLTFFPNLTVISIWLILNFQYFKFFLKNYLIQIYLFQIFTIQFELDYFLIMNFLLISIVGGGCDDEIVK